MKINLLIMLCLSGMCLVSGAEIKTFYDEMLYKYGESSHLLDKVWQEPSVRSWRNVWKLFWSGLIVK